MNRQAFFRVALWTTGSFILGLQLVLPHSLNAVASNDANSLMSKREIRFDGCAVSMESVYPESKNKWLAGDKPVFKITGVNESGKDQDLTFNVVLSSTPSLFSISRTGPVYKEYEKIPVTLHIPASKTESAELTCQTPLPTGIVNIAIARDNKQLAVEQVITNQELKAVVLESDIMDSQGVFFTVQRQ